MSSLQDELVQLAQTDNRYAYEAYEFLWHALAFTQKALGKPQRPGSNDEANGPHHVTGQQLVEGIRQFALEQFGMMAPVVFRTWGVCSTGDFGAIVFRLIEAGKWHCSPSDRREDFEDLYQFDEAFIRDFRIPVDEV